VLARPRPPPGARPERAGAAVSTRAARRRCERHDLPAEGWETRRHAGLVARDRELAHLDKVLWSARRGRSGVLALRGEAGVGKSALIGSAVARATEFHTVQVRGRAPGAGEALPPLWPDAALNEIATSLQAGEPAQRRLVGARGQLERVAAAPSRRVVDAAVQAFGRMVNSSGGPLLVTVDDCHTLPGELVVAMTAAVLGDLADRPVSLVVAWRETPHLEPFTLGRPEVPEHRLGGLTFLQAAQLLATRCEQVPSHAVLSELVGRTGGNPLALIEACGRLTPAQLAGWHPLPDPLPVGDAVVEAFDVVRYLPPSTRRALTVVAAGSADADVVLSAMQRLGTGESDLWPAIEAGIVCRRGPRFDFAHPLVRSVAFHRAPEEVRRAARRALSDALADVDAVEASARQASADLAGPDEVAVRRLSAAAQVALDRGDPAAAARHEELAARGALTADATGQHLADAARHWLAACERERAAFCVELGSELELGAPVAAELAYRRCRLSTSLDAGVADAMVAAAESCLEQRPHRALAMLVDAAAWRVLADDPAGGAALADRAVRLAAAVSTQSEVLARVVRAAAVLEAGGEIDEVAERSHVSLLIGQTERFPSTPEVALVVGRGLDHQGMRRQAERWADWVERCAQRSGDATLALVPLLLDGMAFLADGDVDASSDALSAAVRAAHDTGNAAMGALATQLAAQLHAAAGHYDEGLRDAAAVFGLSERPGARLRVLPALALLELQRGRAGAAVAWARSAEHDLGCVAASGEGPSAAVLAAAPVLASVLFLARAPVDADRFGVRRAGGRSRAAAAGAAWIRGVATEDPAEALEALAEADEAYADRPLHRGLVGVCAAVRLAELGAASEAASRLDAAERAFTAHGAAGLATLAARERASLPRALPGGDPALAPPPAAGRAPSGPDPEWEISVLGGFSVRRRGRPVSLPPSLATQAVKILALRPRITADELIELLWEDAEPGVGARRLRNVLWRIRSACGELLVRDGSFLRLASDALSDLDRFRALADLALVGDDAAGERAVATARAALELYRGELLPGDRYADWAAAPREAASRTQLRLLELLVDDATAADRQGEALVLLDRLAEADPFDERHHLRAAEIHLESGNRGRALDALERAERMLEELDVGPSPAVARLRERLEGAEKPAHRA
jgi:DNA-binding SARP family transcriptional activator/tetratricopeptide (TPR) repeat protein